MCCKSTDYCEMYSRTQSNDLWKQYWVAHKPTSTKATAQKSTPKIKEEREEGETLKWEYFEWEFCKCKTQFFKIQKVKNCIIAHFLTQGLFTLQYFPPTMDIASLVCTSANVMHISVIFLLSVFLGAKWANYTSGSREYL